MSSQPNETSQKLSEKLNEISPAFYSIREEKFWCLSRIKEDSGSVITIEQLLDKIYDWASYEEDIKQLQKCDKVGELGKIYERIISRLKSTVQALNELLFKKLQKHKNTSLRLTGKGDFKVHSIELKQLSESETGDGKEHFCIKYGYEYEPGLSNYHNFSYGADLEISPETPAWLLVHQELILQIVTWCLSFIKEEGEKTLTAYNQQVRKIESGQQSQEDQEAAQKLDL
jgi:hypothetical protein